MLAFFLFVGGAQAQKTELTVSLTEPFFEALLDAVYQNFDPPEFTLATNVQSETSVEVRGPADIAEATANIACSESVKILREMNGLRTAVKFRDGRVSVPLAFVGQYMAPLIGCVEVAGTAETRIDLDFDQDAQKLFGRIRVQRVNLRGTGGVGGGVVARFVQSTIDRKLNPIEVFSIDQASFGFPVQRSGNLKMKALSIRPEVGSGILNLHIAYQFLKG